MFCGKWKKSPLESCHHQQHFSAHHRGGTTKSSGHRTFKKLGLTDDEDVKVMLQGTSFWKVKTYQPQKQRLFRLLEDGMSIWFETRFKKARSKHIFSILHVESVREGYQSEGLRKFGGSFAEEQCFTIVFRGKRKNLDLAARTGSEAQQWVRGLTKLMVRCEAMSQREKLEHWIYGILHEADKNKDNKMSFKEIKNMLRIVNIDMNDIYAYQLFKECDKSNNDRLEEYEIEEFCTRLMKRPELQDIFHQYSGEDCVLSAEELQEFLHDQGEETSLQQAQQIIQKYELNEKARQHNLMMLDGFTMYLLSSAGDILNQAHAEIYQDMSQPLCHYFISSSHNTYLTDSQIGGASSTEAYVRALMKGCRCVELDCWEGSNGDPIIYHGHTLTSKILFRDVIESIRDHAFKHSSYPVILSLENHCGPEQQSIMAHHLKTILGDMLLIQPLDGDLSKQLPSPEELKGKILVKGKKLSENKTDPRVYLISSREEEMQEEEEDQRFTSFQQEFRPTQAKDVGQISRELSDVVVYCRAVPFQSLSDALRHQKPTEMSSFSERKARKLIKDSGNFFVRYNTRHLSRIYPLGLKMNSSNYNPQEMWNVGCQIGFNPCWNEILMFQIQVPDLALVRFVVEDYDTTSSNDFVGQFTLPLLSIREGYRHIHLLSRDGTSLSPATLFVHVRCRKM
ncbi:1-phosphatidylinositol 4,5-bisphosphate phosphodiesterase delta-3 isoform X2 [Erythrolamprus reginae]|uniref:1-phosphatidylinositol 4,5-bisphosphate phosphodiesterase delta-3 isoform X2 n=1 Tax=Erythrolamprus reginae TaxID=121349 RepID=UPI00396C9A36